MNPKTTRAGLAVALSCLVLSACQGGRPDAVTQVAPRAEEGADGDSAIDDVVVIAVIDSGINPYHWDYVGAYMPQHQNADPTDDLPLDRDPAEWLPGHPGRAAFADYRPIRLTLDTEDPFRSTTELHAQDAAQWGLIRYSEGTRNDQVKMYWFPGTKIIGHVAFPPGLIGDPVTSAALGSPSGTVDTWAAESHGIGTSSVSAGNIHGSCPNCLIVYVHGTSEQANEWVAQQDWIDLQTNSWGASFAYRERAYAGSDTELQRQAVERGQQIFFSAGNGQANAFVAPNTTLMSSQEGPDWIVTVGAISPTDSSSYSGHGKPADIASIGSRYPSATGGGDMTTAQGNFSGTSNATPVVAGLYGEALYRLRRLLPGASRMQADGTIARGLMPCGAANPDCALADGALSVHELREALFRAAGYSDTVWNVGGLATLPATGNDAELEFMAEGHGSYRGRLDGDEAYLSEVDGIVGYVAGDWLEPVTQEQADWFAADSYCRQSVWGDWDYGYADIYDLPAADPDWPVRSFLTDLCPDLIGAAVEAERIYYGAF